MLPSQLDLESSAGHLNLLTFICLPCRWAAFWCAQDFSCWALCWCLSFWAGGACDAWRLPCTSKDALSAGWCFPCCEVSPAACRVVLTVMVNSFAWLPSDTALGQAVKPLLTQVYMQVGLGPPSLSWQYVLLSTVGMLPCSSICKVNANPSQPACHWLHVRPTS